MTSNGSPIAGNPATWLLLSKKSPSYGGNEGYADDPTTSYVWDSTVAHGNTVAVGDYVLVWDEDGLLGASVIDDLDERFGAKTRLTCPACKSSKISPRKHEQPTYRCTKNECHHEFDRPVALLIPVKHSVADYGPAWIDLRDSLPADAVRQLAAKPKSIQSIRPAVSSRVDAVLPGVRQRLSALAPRWEATTRTSGHRLVITRTRVGQGEFRRRLLAEFGERCAITGASPAAALDAAHLYSYSKVGEHRDHGGLLLRRDMHSLFDRHLLGIDPGSERVVVAPSLRSFAHLRAIHDTPLDAALNTSRRRWIDERWRIAEPFLS